MKFWGNQLKILKFSRMNQNVWLGRDLSYHMKGIINGGIPATNHGRANKSTTRVVDQWSWSTSQVGRPKPGVDQTIRRWVDQPSRPPLAFSSKDEEINVLYIEKNIQDKNRREKEITLWEDEEVENLAKEWNERMRTPHNLLNSGGLWKFWNFLGEDFPPKLKTDWR